MNPGQLPAPRANRCSPPEKAPTRWPNNQIARGGSRWVQEALHLARPPCFIKKRRRASSELTRRGG